MKLVASAAAAPLQAVTPITLVAMAETLGFATQLLTALRWQEQRFYPERNMEEEV